MLRLHLSLLTFLCLMTINTPYKVVAQDDVADIPSRKYELKNKLVYYTIGDESEKIPDEGLKLLVILPGGDGSESFGPFLKRIYKHALGDDYLVIQLVAPVWNRSQQIVWPIEKLSTRGMKVPTEEFIVLAVEDVKKRTKINPKHVYTLGWSSSGGAVYTTGLLKETPITGTFIAMSVYKPDFLPPLSQAKDRSFYFLHSEEDRVCPYRFVEKAVADLTENGANVKLVTYSGGHGWRGNVFGNISEGVNWLESRNED